MSVTIRNVTVEQIAATDDTVYTADGNLTGRVIKCTLTNDTTTTVTVSAHKVEDGGAVGADRLIMNGKVLASKETYECPEIVGQTFNPGMFLSMIASVATQVTLSLDVVETTQ